MKEFTREELLDIRDRAYSESRKLQGSFWSIAHFALAVAADYLDAMIARCGEIGE